MSMVVSGPQVTCGVPRNNNASDHGNTNRRVSGCFIEGSKSAKYGVWVESVGDAAKILGISRNTMKSERWREQSHAGCIPYIYPFIENAPTVSFGTYKRIGRQNCKQRIAWDSRTITDIEAFLTCRLGAPVILGIQETKPAEIKNYAAAEPLVRATRSAWLSHRLC